MVRVRASRRLTPPEARFHLGASVRDQSITISVRSSRSCERERNHRSQRTLRTRGDARPRAPKSLRSLAAVTPRNILNFEGMALCSSWHEATKRYRKYFVKKSKVWLGCVLIEHVRYPKSGHPRVRHSPPKEKTPGRCRGCTERSHQRKGCPVGGGGAGTDDDCVADDCAVGGCGGLRGGTARD